MSREKQIEEMAKDLCDIECKGMKCNTCDTYGCEYRMQAEALYNAGYRRQRVVIADFTERVKHIAEGVKFKNNTEKTAFIEMLEDLARLKGGAE